MYWLEEKAIFDKTVLTVRRQVWKVGKSFDFDMPILFTRNATQYFKNMFMEFVADLKIKLLKHVSKLGINYNLNSLL